VNVLGYVKALMDTGLTSGMKPPWSIPRSERHTRKLVRPERANCEAATTDHRTI
jgi:hypothetical protein